MALRQVFLLPFVLTGLLAVVAAWAPPTTVGGTVKSVSADGMQITLVVGTGKAAKDQTFRLTGESKISLDGKLVKPEELVEGTKVTLSYDKTSGEVIAIRITATKSDSPQKPAAESNKPAGTPARTPSRVKGGAATPGAASDRSGEWPQWRGPDRSGVSKETGLLKEWPSDGPPLEWQASGLGEAYGTVTLEDQRIYTMGKRGNEEFVFALDVLGGKQVWATPIGSGQTKFSVKNSKSTPTLDGELLYAVGMNGTLVCLETATGKLQWKKEYEAEFRGRMMSDWGWSESPLVDGDKVICTPGNDQAALVAMNKKTGQVIWKSAIQNCGGSGYSSIVVAEVGGVRQYITVLGKSGGLVGVSAKDGKLLWRNNRVAGGTANVPTPVVRDNLVFYTTGYQDGGSALLRLVPAGGSVKAEEVYVKSAEELRNHHGGVVLVGDYLYGGHGQNQGFPFCLELKTGKLAWGKQRGPGSESAAVTCADGNLYFRYQNAVVALIEATPRNLNVKGSFRIPNGSTPSWSHPVVAGGHLYLRDHDRLLCYDVRVNRSTAQVDFGR